MGISVLTVMEFIELLINLVFLLFNSESRQETDDEEYDPEDKHNMLEHHDNQSQPNSKYDHFQYDRPIFNSPFDRHAESPI